MWFYESIKPIELLEGHKFISFIGGGGKTSFIKYLAKEFSKKGEKVVITTTTKMWAEEPFLLLRGEEGLPVDLMSPFMVGKDVINGKITAISEKEIEYLRLFFDKVLIEADGAKTKPIKFPASYEPAIPHITEKVIVLCGLDSLFKRIDETVFRWGLLCRKTGIPGHELINPELFFRFFSNDILLKGTEKKDLCIFLNKYDLCESRDIVFDMAKNLIRRLKINGIYISSIKFGMFYRVNHYADIFKF
ncbi:MAG TPA: selenium cofactor biosynthesis protein YqeC [Syntrophorhabdaceae bacterium]|nr:selenium cofactor biosynthesis protein YqeC [Syntrophorhabdaceae bacterium]